MGRTQRRVTTRKVVLECFHDTLSAEEIGALEYCRSCFGDVEIIAITPVVQAAGTCKRCGYAKHRPNRQCADIKQDSDYLF